MRRWLLAAVVMGVWIPSTVRADVFDRYTNPVLMKAPETEGVKEAKQLTAALLDENDKATGVSGTLLIVKTNGGRFAKLLVEQAAQRTANGQTPVLAIDRFVCYKPDQDRSPQALGQKVQLYNGFQFNLDLGQVVPADVGGDLKFVAEGTWGHVEPVGQAKMYVVTKKLPGTEAAGGGVVVAGETFQAKYWTGSYVLHDDGRRNAKLTLKVEASGDVTGEYVSEDTGRGYEVYGKVLNPKHQIQFFVKFPQTEQAFQGWMFTKDGAAICGTCRMQERDFGFYALRVVEK